MDTPLCQGDVVLTLGQTAAAPQVRKPERPEQARPAAPVPPAEPAAPVPPAEPASGSEPARSSGPARRAGVRSGELHVRLNGKPLTLPAKENGGPYYLMDLLEHSDIDFEHLDRTVCLRVNGVEQGFQHELKEQDSVSITLV